MTESIRNETDRVAPVTRTARVERDDQHRASWGAIFAGIIIALVAQMLLSLLGMAIGFGLVDPTGEANPMDGFGIGAAIYFVVSSIVSLFAGGYVAGSLAEVQTTRDRTLHGLLTWAGATLLLFLLLTTAVGNLIGGTANLIGKGLSGVGSAVAAAAPAVVSAADDEIDGADFVLNALREEVRSLLRQTDTPALQPDALEDTAENAVDTTQTTARQAAMNPAASDEELDALFDRLEARGDEVLQAADRDALVNIVQARAGVTRAEAEQMVAGYEETYREVRAEWEQSKAEAEQTARGVADEAADNVAQAALWTFLMMLAGAIAAAVGGNMGANSRTVVTRTDTRQPVL